MKHQFGFFLTLTLFLLLAFASICDAQQQTLSDDMIRLHVIANSDSDADQALKLRVRDRILSYITPLLSEADDARSMQKILGAHMQEIAQTAQAEITASGCTDTVSVSLAEEYYPTRNYDTFSLPAGTYTGLRVRIGSAQGHNWWCVVYPSLCLDPASGTAELTDDQLALIERDGTQYAVAFRVTEWVGALRHALSSEQ
ncbi:MAG: stage II sporulation protein R [Butyricicoccaceae bacterium]